MCLVRELYLVRELCESVVSCERVVRELYLVL